MATRKTYRKTPKPTPGYEGLEPWEIEHMEAGEAMAQGAPEPIGQYLRQVMDVLRVIADRLDPREDADRILKFTTKPQPMEDESDWNSTHEDVRRAIASRAARPVGWYLRDVADTLSRLANMFDPDATSREDFRVQFVRKSKGRPKGGSAKMSEERQIRMDVLAKGGHRRGGKESAVMEVMAKRKKSRATVYRASRRPGK